MTKRYYAFAALALTGAVATTALGGGHASPESAAVKARQAQMALYSFNLGILGNMVKGASDYDAEAAGAAAGNLAAVSALNGMAMWLPGTDTEALGTATRALPKIWEAGSDVGAKAQAMASSSAALAAVAGDGLDAMKAAFGDVGKACGDCHKAYRGPRT